MSRWNAAGIHLAISATIGAAVLALLFFVWYPAPYFRASGGMDLTMILLGVDLVLGPLLTLVVFKAGKKSLRFDLSVIGVLQLSALLYGVHVISEARPVFIVAAVDRFTVVAANDLADSDLAEGSTAQFQTRSWTGPLIVSAPLPADPVQRDAVLDSSIAGKDIERLPKHYAEYAREAPNLLLRAKSVKELRSLNPTQTATIDAWLSTAKREESSVVWVPVYARQSTLTMLLDANSGAVIETLAIDPTGTNVQ